MIWLVIAGVIVAVIMLVAALMEMAHKNDDEY